MAPGVGPVPGVKKTAKNMEKWRRLASKYCNAQGDSGGRE